MQWDFAFPSRRAKPPTLLDGPLFAALVSRLYCGPCATILSASAPSPHGPFFLPWPARESLDTGAVRGRRWPRSSALAFSPLKCLGNMVGDDGLEPPTSSV